MSQYNSIIAITLMIILSCLIGTAQDNSFTLKGKILDAHTKEPVEFATIYLKEKSRAAITDSLGSFRFDLLPSGSYHIAVSYLGFEPKEYFLSITRDTSIDISLDQDCHILEEVEIIGHHHNVSLQSSKSVNNQWIQQHSTLNLAEVLQTISGVNVIKSGGDIGIPIVQGMYGNRLTILNNGVTQAGQQWGLDHNPEIDPFVAKQVTVIKGVASLQFQGSTLGNVVLVEPGTIGNEPHLHGKINYAFATNGRSHNINTELKSFTKNIGWRINATYKKGGDRNTPSYFLRNTGSTQRNAAVQIEKSFKNKLHSQLYFSTFNATYGILRGSHIGNLSDLEDALGRSVPFFTEDSFSYDIDRPYQDVGHVLIKSGNKYFFDANKKLEINYAFQRNQRKEFDIRRSSQNQKPALSLEALAHFVEGKFENINTDFLGINTGVQLSSIKNTNIPETDILPLIPNYTTNQIGQYGIVSKEINKWRMEAGWRVELLRINAAVISQTLPREVRNYNKTFINRSFSTGVRFEPSPLLHSALNFGYAQRQPAVNELYSNGLHQGVSGIEIGDPNLGSETSLKASLSLDGKFFGKLHIESMAYIQNIDNYIYLAPDGEVRLTIRGAFPLFRYIQTNALIAGWDVTSKYDLSKRWSAETQWSLIRGIDRDKNQRLVYMPSNNLQITLQYHFPDIKHWRNLLIRCSEHIVFAQTELDLVQDYAPPPPGYHLFNMSLSGDLLVKHVKINTYLQIENVFNATYRDYLNRMRYFADDTGRNVVAGVVVSF
ncbi:MAG: TonB-dependent receptor [Saprospiraceae bacterium]